MSSRLQSSGILSRSQQATQAGTFNGFLVIYQKQLKGCIRTLGVGGINGGTVRSSINPSLGDGRCGGWEEDGDGGWGLLPLGVLSLDLCSSASRSVPFPPRPPLNPWRSAWRISTGSPRDSEGYAKGISRDGMGRLSVTNADDNGLVLVFYIHTDATKHAYTCTQAFFVSFH